MAFVYDRHKTPLKSNHSILIETCLSHYAYFQDAILWFEYKTAKKTVSFFFIKVKKTEAKNGQKWRKRNLSWLTEVETKYNVRRFLQNGKSFDTK